MKINEEILRELGFKKVKIGEGYLFRYQTNVADLYLDEEDNCYKLYEKKKDNFEHINKCRNISEVIEKIIVRNNMNSFDRGKELKQEEIRTVLGIK